MDTPCHKEGGCIRAFEDDNCGDQGQCSIVLAVLAERERCARLANSGVSRHGVDPWAKGYRCAASEIAGAIMGGEK